MSTRQSGVEVRSIDYVPLSERHGELWHLGPLWFMGNAQIATLAVGVVGVEAGGNLLWSLIAIVTGVLTGTFFMAFHSAQGPQLGLPQMIQSRPQFGYIGALLVWLFAYELLLTPSMQMTAFPVGILAPATIDGRPVDPFFDDWVTFCLPANLTGQPASSVPIGLGDGGLPIGLQIVGPRWADAAVLGAAAAVEVVLPG
jgi:hypothetical protein